MNHNPFIYLVRPRTIKYVMENGKVKIVPRKDVRPRRPRRVRPSDDSAAEAEIMRIESGQE
jgi:hypothetical protein